VRVADCAYAGSSPDKHSGHNSKAMHRAYAKHAEVTVPSLTDWEKECEKNPQRNVQLKLLPVDFPLPFAVTESN
jgi:hypothetical protein